MRSLPDIVRHTERMELRALRAEDEHEFVRTIVQSADAWRPWVPSGSAASTPEDLFRRELDRGLRGARAGTHLRLAGFDVDGRLVALFSLNEIVRGVFESAHAGWQVAAPRMGEGLGTEGAQALLSIAFDAEPEGLGLHRVQANIMPANAASLRVAEKLGFRREGLAQRYLRIAGGWEAHAMFALTAEEWPTEQARSIGADMQS